MKEITVKLTEQEIELLMDATQSASAKAKMLVYEGRASAEKMKSYTDRLCKVNSKLYQIILKLHEQEA